MNYRKIVIRKKGGTLKFQEGGEVPMDSAAGQAPGKNPQMELQTMLSQYAENKTPEVAMMIADFLLQQMMSAQQTQPTAAPTEAPMEEAPMAKYGMELPMKLKLGRS
jgi:hypothetical protein